VRRTSTSARSAAPSVSPRGASRRAARPGRRFEIGAAGAADRHFLKFKDSRKYFERLAEAQEQTAEGDALVVMQGSIRRSAWFAPRRSRFHGRLDGARRGRALRGRRRAACVDRAEAAVVCVTASGGARMQEGLLSLAADGQDHGFADRSGGARSAVRDGADRSTMGGVSASFPCLATR